MAAYQQHFPFPLAFASPAAAAAHAAAAAAAAAKTAEGVPADSAGGAAAPAVSAVPAMPVAAVAYPIMDPQLLARQMAAAAAQAQAAFPIPLPHPAAAAAAAAAAANASHQGPNPRNDRHFWKEHEQQELLRLVADQQYRQTVLGEHRQGSQVYRSCSTCTASPWVRLHMSSAAQHGSRPYACVVGWTCLPSIAFHSSCASLAPD